MTFSKILTMELSNETREVFGTAYDLINRMSEVAERETPFAHWSWVDETTGECITDEDVPRLLGALSFLASNYRFVIGDQSAYCALFYHGAPCPAADR